MRVAVVGHVEWVEFASVERMPAAGDIVESVDTFDVPAGGGAVAAAQLAKLAGSAMLFTALSKDEFGRRARSELTDQGVEVLAATRGEPQRRALTLVDRGGERTIIVVGEKLVPRREDSLPWERLAEADAVYFVSGDLGALEVARGARVLVATARVLGTLAEGGVALDALVASDTDEGERYEPGTLEPAPRLVVRTAGAQGGSYELENGASGTFDAAPVPGPVGDTYGAGDSFAAGLTFALGARYETERALELAARCGAACLSARGPYDGQLVSA